MARTPTTPPRTVGQLGAPLTPNDHWDTWGKAQNADLNDPNSSAYQAYDVRNAQQTEDRYQANQNAANARVAPTTDYARADFARDLGMGARGSQSDALGMYRDAANGVGTSVAQAQFAQALQQQQREQASMAASTRGGGLQRAAAQRMAMNNSADMGANSAAASATLRAQEIAAARGGYGGLATGMRGQDLGQQAQDAGQAQYLSSLAMQNRAQNDSQNNVYETARQHLMDLGFQGQLHRQGAIGDAVSSDQRQQAINNGATDVSDARTDKYIQGGGALLGAAVGSLAGPAGTAGGAAAGGAAGTAITAASDERSKTDIRDATAKLSSFLDALKAADYSYKDSSEPGASPGRHTSVMAQDLEKSELGRRMVTDTPTGKMVDYKEGFATLLAAQASLKDELGDLKKALNTKHRRAA